MISFITQAIRLAAAFLFGSTGETIVEKSGHLNLGIPGIMCIGAVGGCLGESIYLGSLSSIDAINPFLAVLIPTLFALVFSALMGVLYSFFTVTLHTNQNITGLTITTFGIGFSSYLIQNIDTSGFSKASACFKTLFPFYSNLGIFGELFLSYGFLTYLALIVAIASYIILKKTRIGMNLRAVGESPATADAAGISVSCYRYSATIIGCAISGLGGLFFIMDFLGGNWEYVVDIIGWLAVALVIFTLWNPLIGIFGSFVFSALYIVSSYVSVPFNVIDIIKMLPYLVTILVLIITSIIGSKKAQAPSSLGNNYFREDR
ncbi:MAG: ABC transporter permease [Bacilli bacterium]